MIKQNEFKKYALETQANMFVKRVKFNNKKALKLAPKLEDATEKLALDYVIKMLNSPKVQKYNHFFMEMEQIIAEIIEIINNEEAYGVTSVLDYELLKLYLKRYIEFFVMGAGMDAYTHIYEQDVIFGDPKYGEIISHYKHLNEANQEVFKKYLGHSQIMTIIDNSTNYHKIDFSLDKINDILKGYDLQNKIVTPVGRLGYTLYCLGAGVTEIKDLNGEFVEVIVLAQGDNFYIITSSLAKFDSHIFIENQNFIAGFDYDQAPLVNAVKIDLALGSSKFLIYSINNNFEPFYNLIEAPKYAIDGSELTNLGVFDLLGIDPEVEAIDIRNVTVKKMKRPVLVFDLILSDEEFNLLKENQALLAKLQDNLIKDINMIYNRRNNVIKAEAFAKDVDFDFVIDEDLTRKEKNEAKRQNQAFISIKISNAIMFEAKEIMESIKLDATTLMKQIKALIQLNTDNFNYNGEITLDEDEFMRELKQTFSATFMNYKVTLPEVILTKTQYLKLLNYRHDGANFVFNTINIVNQSLDDIKAEIYFLEEKVD